MGTKHRSTKVAGAKKALGETKMKAMACPSRNRTGSRVKEILGSSSCRHELIHSQEHASRCSGDRNRGIPADACTNSIYLSQPCTAFVGDRLFETGSLIEVALAARAAVSDGLSEAVTIFNDTTGCVVELNLLGSQRALIAQLYEQSIKSASREAETQGLGSNSIPSRRRRGRPKLGVVSREVSLLPQHWEWLSAQPGGASVMLRRLVEKACHESCDAHPEAVQRERAYQFISTVGKSLPNFNETASALLSGDRERFTHELSFWPVDIASYALRLAFGSEASATNSAPISE